MNPILTSAIVISFIFIVIILLWYGIYIFHSKIIKITKNNKTKVGKYAKEISVGIASGIIVVVLDKTISLFFSDLPTLSFTNISSFFLSLLNVMFSVLIASGVIIFSVFFLYYSLIKHLKK